MSFIRRIKKKSGVYLAEVESQWKNGKVKQKFIRYVGKEVKGKLVQRVTVDKLTIDSVKRYADLLAVDSAATALGLKETLGPKYALILILVYSQILERLGIYQIPEWLQHTEMLEILGLTQVSTSQLYAALGEVNELDWGAIQREFNSRWNKFEPRNRAVVIDVTDTYFSGHCADWKARRGKDSIHSKLIQMALGVSFQYGFPLLHKVYDGNIHSLKIFEDLIVELKMASISSVILDRGMYSVGNLDALERLGVSTIVGVRKEPSLKKAFVATMDRDEIFLPNNRVQLKNSAVYALAKKYRQGSLIIVYNPEIEVAERERFIEQGGQKPQSRGFGYSLLYHNTDLSTEAAVHKYFDKDVVERAFKQLKGPLSLRPIRVWLRQNVQAHMHVCYLAYAIYAYLNYKLRGLRLSATDAIRSLQTAYQIQLSNTATGDSFTKLITLSRQQSKIVRKLNLVYKTD